MGLQPQGQHPPGAGARPGLELHPQTWGGGRADGGHHAAVCERGFFSLMMRKAKVRVRAGLRNRPQVRTVLTPRGAHTALQEQVLPGQQSLWLLCGLWSWKALGSKTRLRAKLLPGGQREEWRPPHGFSGHRPKCKSQTDASKGPCHRSEGSRASGPGLRAGAGAGQGRGRARAGFASCGAHPLAGHRCRRGPRPSCREGGLLCHAQRRCTKQ